MTKQTAVACLETLAVDQRLHGVTRDIRSMGSQGPMLLVSGSYWLLAVVQMHGGRLRVPSFDGARIVTPESHLVAALPPWSVLALPKTSRDLHLTQSLMLVDPSLISHQDVIDPMGLLVDQPPLPGRIEDVVATIEACVAQGFPMGLKRKSSSIGRKVKAHVDSHAFKGVALRELAKELRIPLAYCSRYFNGDFGLTPQRYAIELRCAMATVMLLRGASVADVASRVGYASRSAFLRQYQSRIGLAPSEIARRAVTKL